jgi:hypothetical protein
MCFSTEVCFERSRKKRHTGYQSYSILVCSLLRVLFSSVSALSVQTRAFIVCGLLIFSFTLLFILVGLRIRET